MLQHKKKLYRGEVETKTVLPVTTMTRLNRVPVYGHHIKTVSVGLVSVLSVVVSLLTRPTSPAETVLIRTLYLKSIFILIQNRH